MSVRNAYRPRATAAPRRFPFFDHRTLAEVDQLQSARGQHAALIEPARTSPEGRSTPFMPCGSPAIPFYDALSENAECGRAASAGFSFHDAGNTGAPASPSSGKANKISHEVAA